LNGSPTKRVLAWQYWDDDHIARMKTVHTGTPYIENKTATTAVAIPSHKVRDYWDVMTQDVSSGYQIAPPAWSTLIKISLITMLFPGFTDSGYPWLDQPNRQVWVYGSTLSDHTGEIWAPTQIADQYWGRTETKTATIRRPYSYDEETDDGFMGMKIFFRDMVYSSGAHEQVEGGAWKMLPFDDYTQFYNTSGVLVYFLAQDR